MHGRIILRYYHDTVGGYVFSPLERLVTLQFKQSHKARWMTSCYSEWLLSWKGGLC